MFLKNMYTCIEIIFLKYLEQLQPLKTLKLPYTFRSAIFFEFRFFGLSNDPNEISKGENCFPCLVNIFYSIDSGQGTICTKILALLHGLNSRYHASTHEKVGWNMTEDGVIFHFYKSFMLFVSLKARR